MIAEFKGKKEHLQLLCDRKIEEFKFIDSIVKVNTSIINSQPDTAGVMSMELKLASLDYENIAASFPLDYWRVEYGEQLIIPILCDTMSYFLRQFQVKEVLSDAQIMQLAIKLLSAQPKLRIMELVFVFNQALQGAYGPTYQRIGIDTILGWLTKFYEESAIHLENKIQNSKQDESRGSAPWEAEKKQMEKYAEEQRKKKTVTEQIWGFAKEKQVKEEQLFEKEEDYKAWKEKFNETQNQK